MVKSPCNGGHLIISAPHVIPAFRTSVFAGILQGHNFSNKNYFLALFFKGRGLRSLGERREPRRSWVRDFYNS
jgi:hypothetical protein